MLKYFHFFIALIISINVSSQSVTTSFGPIFTKTNAIVPVKNGKEDFSNTDYFFSFSYEHFVRNKKYSIITSYGKYDGCTFIYFEEGGWVAGGGEALARGFCAGVDLHRFDLGLLYLLTGGARKFYFKPQIAVGLQLSRKTGVEFWRDGLPINGPSYFELEPMSAESMNTTQIVPSVGFRTGFVFWKRLDIGLCVQGVYAYKPYQKMYLKYQYKGVEQSTAEYESTGTGLFVTVGVGYRFAKLIK